MQFYYELHYRYEKKDSEIEEKKKKKTAVNRVKYILILF